jgi:glutamate-1-semialdehyde 2,1-aminomutase
VKLSRAYTGRDLVALCADHPFFSVDDWFIGTTAIDAGIPEAIKKLSVTFRYNDLASVEQLFASYPNRIACVILEPAKYGDPQDQFLHRVRDLCHKHGAVFILDEMITGFRWHKGGAQKLYGIVPDLSTFGKALANGFALSALAGKRDLMKRGGMYHDDERVFLLSTTHGAETHALAAGIATMQTYQHEPVIETLDAQGRRLQSGLQQSIESRGLSEYVQIIGPPCALVHATSDASKQRSQEFRTLLMQELVRRGILATSLVVSYAHTDEDIDRTIDAWDEAMVVYGRALEDGVDKHLIGPASKSVYRKFN